MDRTEEMTKIYEKTGRVAFIRARWHATIVDQAAISFVDKMDELTGGQAEIDLFDVPGVFEIPLLAKKLAETGKYAGIVGCGFVVDGGIYHHEFVSASVVEGLMRGQMETGVPMFSVVLTPHNFQEVPSMEKFFFDHFAVKGEEAANAVVQTLDVHASLEGPMALAAE